VHGFIVCSDISTAHGSELSPCHYLCRYNITTDLDDDDTSHSFHNVSTIVCLQESHVSKEDDADTYEHDATNMTSSSSSVTSSALDHTFIYVASCSVSVHTIYCFRCLDFVRADVRKLTTVVTLIVFLFISRQTLPARLLTCTLWYIC